MRTHNPRLTSQSRSWSARVALRVLLTLAAITVLPRPAYSDILYTWVPINQGPYTGSMIVDSSALVSGQIDDTNLLSIDFELNGQSIFHLGLGQSGTIHFYVPASINSSGVMTNEVNWYALDPSNNYIGSTTGLTWTTYTSGMGGYQAGLTIQEDNGMGPIYQLNGCMQIDTNYTPPQSVPEPSSIALAGCGAACWLAYGCAAHRRKRRQARIVGSPVASE